ncbi:MAG: hypothetical protein HC883_03900 [Bdellovibrionaceae bacterium]|nr:hypothetical protein [Pseudobdellovibrionaceae bacterium]
MEGGRVVVPCMINFAEIRTNVEALVRVLRATLPDTMPSEVTLKRLLAAGLVAVLIDDVDQKNERSMVILSQFIRTFPACRFIFTVQSSIYQEIGADFDLRIDTEFDRVYLERFSRAKMRLLIEKWNGQSADRNTVSALLNKLIEDIVHINLPLTAVNGTIFLMIFEDVGDFRPVNRAVLIEKFVEVLLDKASLANALRATMDYTNKTDYLSQLAQRMVETGEYVLDRLVVTQFTMEYFKHIGIKQAPEAWVEYFVDAKFELREGRISFRYRAFCEFFIAWRMRESSEFRRGLIESERYLAFINEFEYYSGLTRKDVALLSMLSTTLNDYRAIAYKEMGWAPNIQLFDRLSPIYPTTDDYFQRVERSCLSRPYRPGNVIPFWILRYPSI